jgi:hypothetical protein
MAAFMRAFSPADTSARHNRRQLVQRAEIGGESERRPGREARARTGDAVVEGAVDVRRRHVQAPGIPLACCWKIPEVAARRWGFWAAACVGEEDEEAGAVE